jgi:dynein heavy chain, axonemal
VITISFGHCLLVGVGGSGRKSLATLSAFIAFSNEVQVIDSKNDVKIWVEEMQRIMKIAGIDMKSTLLLFSDTQIFSESLLEDICNILNNGEVPNLFPPEEKSKIIEEITDPAAQTNV